MSLPHNSVNVQLPGYRSPAAGYEAPFEMLTACHERVQRTLALLQRLHEHVAQHGGDAQAVQAGHDVLRYFDQAAVQHHLDEERHVFPRVLALNDEALTQVVRRLQQDHRDMESSWSRVRVQLHRLVEAGDQVSPDWVKDSRELIQGFARLYERHIADEELRVYPAAQGVFSQEALSEMAQDMMQRRGLRLG